MSLLSKLERLEKAISTKHDEGIAERSREVIADMVRSLEEFAARPKQTIHEQIAWLRETIRENEALDEHERFLDQWCRKELARLEAELAKLQ